MLGHPTLEGNIITFFLCWFMLFKSLYQLLEVLFIDFVFVVSSEFFHELKHVVVTQNPVHLIIVKRRIDYFANLGLAEVFKA